MIKAVVLPIVWRISISEIDKALWNVQKNSAYAELDAALAEGYVKFDTQMTDDPTGRVIIIILHKGDEAQTRLPALTEHIADAWRICILSRQQNSEFVFEADDNLVKALGQILPSSTFTDDEMES